MAVRKQNISLPVDVADAIDRRAAIAGVTFSAWLAEAARRQLRREEGLAAVAEWEAEHGKLPEGPPELIDLGHDVYSLTTVGPEALEDARRAAEVRIDQESGRKAARKLAKTQVSDADATMVKTRRDSGGTVEEPGRPTRSTRR